MNRLVVVFAALAMTCAAATFGSPALAAYHIEAKGAESKAGKAFFKLGESGSFTCIKNIAKQPNSTGKELITEEQSLITTLSECTGKLGGVAAKVSINPEVNLTIGVGEKEGGSETKWRGIPVSIAKEAIMKILGEGGLECTVKVPSESNKGLKEIKWEDVNVKKGEYQSKYLMAMTAEGTAGGGIGCELMQLPKGLRWFWELFWEQGGESYF